MKYDNEWHYLTEINKIYASIKYPQKIEYASQYNSFHLVRF